MSCDTFVVLPANDNVPVLFAKNSDREPTEAQNIVHLKRATHKAGSMVNCQRLSIKQVAETFDVVLFQPHWLWGGEMGVNEHSVCIGNEAVFTNSKFTSNKPVTFVCLLLSSLKARIANLGRTVFDWNGFASIGVGTFEKCT